MFQDIPTELSEDQIAQLEEAKKLIPKLREQLRRARTAGLDVSAQEQQLAELEQQISKIYAVYVRRSIT